MQQGTKLFIERLNECLNETGAPASPRERAIILSKMLDIPKQQAWSLLEGHLLPDNHLLQRISQEFEINSDEWLRGEKR